MQTEYAHAVMLTPSLLIRTARLSHELALVVERSRDLVWLARRRDVLRRMHRALALRRQEHRRRHAPPRGQWRPAPTCAMLGVRKAAARRLPGLGELRRRQLATRLRTPSREISAANEPERPSP